MVNQFCGSITEASGQAGCLHSLFGSFVVFSIYNLGLLLIRQRFYLRLGMVAMQRQVIGLGS